MSGYDWPLFTFCVHCHEAFWVTGETTEAQAEALREWVCDCRPVIRVSAEEYDELQRRLAEPPKILPGLAALLTETPDPRVLGGAGQVQPPSDARVGEDARPRGTTLARILSRLRGWPFDGTDLRAH